MLSNKDLHKNINKYTIGELEQNIQHLYLWDILQTQLLTCEFCFIYFWDPNDSYAKDKDDATICMQDVLNWQPHLTREALYSCSVYKARLKNA